MQLPIYFKVKRSPEENVNTVAPEATPGGDSEFDLNLGHNHENKVLFALCLVGGPHRAL